MEINAELFHNRLHQFITEWRADKRNGDVLFGGVGSIVILTGKSEDQNQLTYRKSNAMHVSLFREPSSIPHEAKADHNVDTSFGYLVTNFLGQFSYSLWTSSTL